MALDAPEEWRAVAGYDGYYEVSCQGRMRSLDRIVPHPILPKGQRVWGRVLRPHRITRGKGNPTPMFEVTLSMEGTPKQFMVARLVYAAFIGPIVPGNIILHFDEDSSNNAKDNLWQVTQPEAMVLLPHANGERCRSTVLTEEQVRAARMAWKSRPPGLTIEMVAAQHGVAESTMAYVLGGKSWKHVK